MERPRARIKKRPHTRAEQQLSLKLVADAIQSGEIRTFKQLEKLGFIYAPDQAPRPPRTQDARPVRGLT